MINQSENESKSRLRLRITAIRRAAAILFVLACVGTVSWAVVVSYEEETTDWFLNIDSLRFDAKQYRVNINSIDEVAGKATATAQLTLDKHSFVSSTKIKGPIDGSFLLYDLDVRFGPLRVSDLAPQFDSIGFLVLNSLVDRIPELPPSDFKSEPPPVSQMEFSILGEPKFYPFDKYFIIGYASSIVLVSPDKRQFFSVDDDHTEVYLRAPNFVMRGASNSELLKWPRMGETPQGMQLQKDLLKNNLENRKKMFAVLLQRPFFLRFFAIFLLVITLASMFYYAVASDVRTFALQAVAYFVGLWAVRQMLVSGGPKVFTAVDYVILLLYATLAAIVIAKALWTNTTPPEPEYVKILNDEFNPPG